MKNLLFKLTLLSGHILLTLAPIPVFYFVSNFMGNILLGPCSANCLRQMKRGVEGVIFLRYVIDQWLIIVNVIKMFANLYGYVMVYDSYTHHSKYPFDNYRINVLQWGRGHIFMV